MADDFSWHMTGTTAWSGTFDGKADVRGRMLKSLFAQFATPYKNTPRRVEHVGWLLFLDRLRFAGMTVREMRRYAGLVSQGRRTL